MEPVLVVSAVRTPIGKFLGSLSALTAPELGAAAIREAIRRSGARPEEIDEVLMGNVLQAGVGQAPARQAAIRAGVSPSVPAVTINQVCGSGLRAVMFGASAIRAREADCVVAGGMESMSNAPYILPAARRGARLGNVPLVDHLVSDGLWDSFENFHMGETAELVSERYRVSRRAMDEYALESHKKAAAAAASGAFSEEIVAVRTGADSPAVEKDEGPRADASLESLSRLKPVFRPENGSVTPGNSSTINDAGAALVLMSETRAAEKRVRPLARILGYASGGLEPRWVMMAPVEAVKNLRARSGLDIHEMDLVEINEAFAAQSVALIRELALDPGKVNVNGGAIALGHPIGASGARILVTLIHALRRRKLRRGLATLCLGGGNAVAMAVEALP